MSDEKRVADKPDVAGGLEDLQREWREKVAQDFPHSKRKYVFEECADALAPHIAAAKEREGKLRKLESEMRDRGFYAIADRLAEILGGGKDGGKA